MVTCFFFFFAPADPSESSPILEADGLISSLFSLYTPQISLKLVRCESFLFRLLWVVFFSLPPNPNGLLFDPPFLFLSPALPLFSSFSLSHLSSLAFRPHRRETLRY